MSKAVLLSIKPEYCHLIAKGRKTLELRTRIPNLEIPYKAYIYCTSSDLHKCLMQNEYGVDLIHCINYKTAIPCGGHIANGKVIGEFICDTYVIDRTYGHDPSFKAAACIGDIEAAIYCTNPKTYGWHISELKIYDKPKEIADFRKVKECHRGKSKENCIGCWDCEITRPPQSWCYVEELV